MLLIHVHVQLYMYFKHALHTDALMHSPPNMNGSAGDKVSAIIHSYGNYGNRHGNDKSLWQLFQTSTENRRSSRGTGLPLRMWSHTAKNVNSSESYLYSKHTVSTTHGVCVHVHVYVGVCVGVIGVMSYMYMYNVAYGVRKLYHVHGCVPYCVCTVYVGVCVCNWCGESHVHV